MKKKKNRLLSTPRKLKIPLIIFAVLFVALITAYISVIVAGLKQGTISVTATIWLTLLNTAILACCLLIVGFGIKLFYQMSQMRFNVDTLGTIKNVKSEAWFLLNVDKIVNEDIHHAALVTFSVYKIKKDAISELGYQIGASVLGKIIETVEDHFRDRPGFLYSYDYNENFLLYIKYDQESEVTSSLNALKDKLSRNLESAGFQMNPDFACGVYFHNEASIHPAEMLRRSRMASDLGNYNGRGGIVLYEDGMLVNDMANNLQLYKEIIQGLEKHEFEIYYQPEFNLKLNRFTDAEALIRWHHPQRGFLTPTSFIPFAEQSDLITQIDHYVFEAVCRDINNWKEEGERLLPISINLSRRSLYKSDTIDFITDTLKQYKTNPLLIKMEITESATSKDSLYILSILKKLKALNIKVSIDDFGTGYSSLSSLKRLPFNVVKIDRSFFEEIEIDEKAREVIRAIVRLVHSLEMTVVAEGIENISQMQLIKEIGFDIVQGWYFCKAMPKEEFLAYIKKNAFERKTTT